VLRPFHRLTRASLEALRYRGEDVARGITRNVVSEARQKELRMELLNSERLKEYFEEHAAERWAAARLPLTPLLPALHRAPSWMCGELQHELRAAEGGRGLPQGPSPAPPPPPSPPRACLGRRSHCCQRG
jgi:hypothetical protein